MVPELLATCPLPLTSHSDSAPPGTHRCTNAQGRRRARRCKADDEGSWDRLDQISSVPIVSSGEGPGGLKLGNLSTGHGDTVREGEANFTV